MKHLSKILIVIILTFFIIPCNIKADNIKAYTKLVSSNNQVFYGKWLIKKVAASSRITEYGDKDIKKILGRTITYHKDKIVYGKHILNDPRYEITKVSETDFFYGGYVELSKLGIKKKWVKEVDVSTHSGKTWYAFGDLFFIKNKNTLILDYGGIFFELIRK
ncbi:hypothetical protein [Clostridium oryzae]|uniref:Uncharacterized protein n=1 Tax=Clostridium oryzae TaxID=1450648 RepID=A0A1V4ISQ2_9CLOT|nr:hypothetical protein [Clostridium oryzae]OPJ63061.1 hypothetical protein CLORY_14270 [Clostridium oryzae]